MSRLCSLRVTRAPRLVLEILLLSCYALLLGAGDAAATSTEGDAVATSADDDAARTSADGDAAATSAESSLRDAEVGEDAERRAGAPRVKLAFKAGRGLVVTSDDGDDELGLSVRVQFLQTFEQSPDVELQQSFQIRRARFGSTGHIMSPHLEYKLELAVAPRDVNTRGGVPQTSPLFDFFINLTQLRDARLRIGQYKVPFDRQRIISSSKLQLVDRAITDGEFTLERAIGFDLHSDDFLGLDLFRYYLGVYPGPGRNSFEFGSYGLLYLGRAEILPFGSFDDYSEADLEGGGLRVSLGGAYAYMNDAPRDHGVLGAVPDDGGTTDLQVATADAMLKLHGFSALSEVFWRNSRRNPGSLVDEAGAPILDETGNPRTLTPSRDGVGFLLQGGYVLPVAPLELVGRYAILDGTDARNRNGLQRLEEFAGGLSYYFNRHPVKLQADFSRLVSNGNYAGALNRVRVQLQAGF